MASNLPAIFQQFSTASFFSNSKHLFESSLIKNVRIFGGKEIIFYFYSWETKINLQIWISRSIKEMFRRLLVLLWLSTMIWDGDCLDQYIMRLCIWNWRPKVRTASLRNICIATTKANRYRSSIKWIWSLEILSWNWSRFQMCLLNIVRNYSITCDWRKSQLDCW